MSTVVHPWETGQGATAAPAQLPEPEIKTAYGPLKDAAGHRIDLLAYIATAPLTVPPTLLDNNFYIAATNAYAANMLEGGAPQRQAICNALAAEWREFFIDSTQNSRISVALSQFGKRKDDFDSIYATNDASKQLFMPLSIKDCLAVTKESNGQVVPEVAAIKASQLRAQNEAAERQAVKAAIEAEKLAKIKAKEDAIKAAIEEKDRARAEREAAFLVKRQADEERKSKYLSWVELCRARNERIAKAKKEWKDAIFERDNAVIVLDNKVTALRMAARQAEAEPIPQQP